jgi:hypothetical protein
VITNEYGVFKVVCDICGMSSCADFETFYEAVEDKELNGYKSEKRNGSWKDICSDCRD